MTGYTDGNNQDLGIIIEGPNDSGSIATATANVVGGVITQLNVVSGGTNYARTMPSVSGSMATPMVLTMMLAVYVGHKGTSLVKFKKQEKYLHLFAGILILISASGILFLGW